MVLVCLHWAVNGLVSMCLSPGGFHRVLLLLEYECFSISGWTIRVIALTKACVDFITAVHNSLSIPLVWKAQCLYLSLFIHYVSLKSRFFSSASIAIHTQFIVNSLQLKTWSSTAIVPLQWEFPLSILCYYVPIVLLLLQIIEMPCRRQLGELDPFKRPQFHFRPQKAYNKCLCTPVHMGHWCIQLISPTTCSINVNKRAWSFQLGW